MRRPAVSQSWYRGRAKIVLDCSAYATFDRTGLMKLLSRVVWSEGMYLGPHHFQAQSRYFEDSIQFATSSLWFAGYGLAGLQLDAEALHNGTVTLLHARGIFPDGLIFQHAGKRRAARTAGRRRSVSSHARRRHRPAGDSPAQAERFQLRAGARDRDRRALPGRSPRAAR